VPPTLDSLQEARVLALASTSPPAGRAHWTLQLLADQVMLLDGMPPLSRELVRRTLKKTTSRSGPSAAG
jgi:hypothetical protein